MLGWLKKLFGGAPAPHPLAGMVFKSNEAFFTYQCKYGPPDITLKQPMIAIIQSDVTSLAERTFGPMEPGGAVYEINVANRAGGKVLMSACIGEAPALMPGDLVAWMPLKRVDLINSWHGLIYAKLAPEFDGHGPKVITRF